jgi:hypothetical protein
MSKSSETVNDRFVLDLHEAVEQSITRSYNLVTRSEYHNVYYIVGPPGGGKTEMMKNRAKTLGFGLLAYTPALERVEKFGGIPDITRHFSLSDGSEYIGDSPKSNAEMNEKGVTREIRTEWSVPQMICEMRDASKKYPFVIVMLDDWHLCPANIQQIGFEVFTHRSLNGHKIPDNVAFVLAGNEKSAAGAKVQLSAIRNRCTMLWAVSDVNHWVDEFAIPTGLHPVGISFFSIKEYQKYFHEEESVSEQYGSPRSWTAAFNNITDLERDKTFDSNKISNKKLMRAIIQGCVGPRAAKEFFNYYDIYSKIPVAQIFATGKIDIPTDPVTRYAYASAVSSKFYNLYIETPKTKKEDREQIEKYSKIFGNVMSELYKTYPEISVKCLRYIADRQAIPGENIPAGPEIIGKMVINNHIPIEYIKKVKQTAEVLKVASR